MFEKINERFIQGKTMFMALSPAKKVGLLAGVAAVLAAFIILLVWANKTSYGVLYTELSQEDAGAIVSKLEERKIPYDLSDNGQTISVPEEIVQETRLSLATEGLPTGGAVGMEVFNKTNLGTTDFVQRLNYQRALQGELERTIGKFPEIEQVRVHLNIPKESLFIEETKEPSASVVVRLQRGKELSRSQLSGIVHLVASSVEGLNAENISVVDTAGGLLYSKSEDDGAVLSESQMRHRRDLEAGLSQRLTSMLERVVGPDKAMARVTAELNFNQIQTNEEVYDPDRSVIRSEQRLKESSSGPGRGAAGTPTATYELGTGERAQTGAGGQGEVYEKSEETTNYEITKISRNILTPAGEVKRLSVAVMVDGIYTETEKDGQMERVFAPRPAEELAQLEELVRNAVGFDEARGDSVVVTSVPFYLPEAPEVTWLTRLTDLARQYGRTVFNILLIVLFFLFVVRPVLAWLKREIQPAPAEPEALPMAEEEEAMLEPERPVKGQLTRDQVLLLAQQDPDRTINVIRSWIDEGRR
jgi:flagellar M-ring protein FliF